MKAFNLRIILVARLENFDLWDSMTLAEVDAIEEYLMDAMVDLNHFNFDDFIINSLQHISKKELAANPDKFFVLYANDDRITVLQHYSYGI